MDITEWSVSATGAISTDVGTRLLELLSSTVHGGTNPDPLAIKVWLGRTTADIQLKNTLEDTILSARGAALAATA